MNENENTKQVTEPQPALAQSEPPAVWAEFSCPKCGKGFRSMNAVRMHNLRVHTPGGGVGYAWRARKPTDKEARVAMKRDYQRNLRARYYSEGKDSRGKPRKVTPVTPKGHHPNSHKKWTPERTAKFKRTMKAKAKKRIEPIIYPLPKNDLEILAEKVTSSHTRKMNHCPYCGEDIVRHLTSGGWQ